MRATNNEKRTLQPVTALTNFAASTILDEKTLLPVRCSDKGCEEPTHSELQSPPKGNPPTTPDTPNCRDRCEKDVTRVAQFPAELELARIAGAQIACSDGQRPC